MIKVFIMFRFFYTKEEWITFAQKLYGNKQFVKYMRGKEYLSSHYNLSVEDYINDVYNKCKNDSEEIEEVNQGALSRWKQNSNTIHRTIRGWRWEKNCSRMVLWKRVA